MSLLLQILKRRQEYTQLSVLGLYFFTSVFITNQDGTARPKQRKVAANNRDETVKIIDSHSILLLKHNRAYLILKTAKDTVPSFRSRIHNVSRASIRVKPRPNHSL